VNVIPLHRPVRQVIAQARNLLAGLMDADLPQAAALAVCQAYNHLEAAETRCGHPRSLPGSAIRKSLSTRSRDCSTTPSTTPAQT
jgi:hypothetical protein